MNFKINKKAIIVCASVFLALAVIATFTDLWVSKMLADIKPGEYFSDNLFGVVGEVFGSFPIYYMIGLSLIILGFNGQATKYEKALFKCSICGYEWRATYRNAKKDDFCCENCLQ